VTKDVHGGGKLGKSMGISFP